MSTPLPIGINTYCLRAFRWTDAQLLDYAASLRLDAIFLQDSLDPKAQDPAHWVEVKQHAARLGLRLETGGGGFFPRSAEELPSRVEYMRAQIRRAAAMGSPLARFVIAGSRAGLPPGSVEQHIETVVKMVRAVRSQALDAGVKIAFEVHKDLQAWEFKTLVEAAGRDAVGIYLDTGNPVFVMEDPMQTVETLAPYAVTVHLRDSVVYEHPRGAAVQWVPLGEGVVDFKAIVARVAEACPNVAVYIKPITGRAPEILNYFEPGFWKLYPNARAADLARFMRLAKSGRPYERTMVIADVPGGPKPAPELEAALRYQQREHLERSVEYGKKTLDLGIRWRS
ncbi:MAG: sugar phosphate isomerase/epimerase [Bryobacteraceae bacterium]|nr:sugar phosphate isomerase/epimerase [Bryobacteraceae bacterium]